MAAFFLGRSLPARSALCRSRFIGELFLRWGTEASNLKVAAAPRVYLPFADESAPTEPALLEGLRLATSWLSWLENKPKPRASCADKEPDRAWGAVSSGP